jgi:trehalose 6-phosphate synthase
VGTPAVHYIHQPLEPVELAPLYRAADVMLVTPLHDGMNLVAKEFVASQITDRGVLVLSESAGAAYELTGSAAGEPARHRRVEAGDPHRALDARA